jgi:disulfide bond formation protein DsbB
MTSGTGDCAEVSWAFLGLSIPGWLLLCFGVLLAMNIMQIRQGSRG